MKTNLNSCELIFFDFIGTYGGAQQSTVTLLNKILSDYSDQITPHFIAVKGTNKQFLDALSCQIHTINIKSNVNIFNIQKKYFLTFIYFFVCIIKISKLLRKYKNKKLIFLCNSPKALLILSILKIFNKINLVYYCRGWGRKQSFNRVVRFLLNFSVDKILCVSNETSDNLKNFIVKKNKIYVTYTSVKLEELDKFYFKKNFDLNDIKILFAGAIIPLKGLHLLINAISDLPNIYKDKITLLIAGKDEENTDYISKCKELCKTIKDQVQWLGWRNDIPYLISQIDLVCLPSFSEGMPRIVQEGMYMGKVVIATPVGGVPTLIENKVNGYIIELDSSKSIRDSIIDLFDTNNFEKIGLRSRDFIKSNFSLDIQVGYVLEALNDENK